MVGMKMNQQEPEDRRTSTRFRIQAPAVATIGSREISAITKDISTRAVYFRTAGEPEMPSIGESLDFLIKIPPSISYPKPSFITGRGRTIRIDDRGGDETGLVVEILEYDIGS
jgi:PilZ domain